MVLKELRLLGWKLLRVVNAYKIMVEHANIVGVFDDLGVSLLVVG